MTRTHVTIENSPLVTDEINAVLHKQIKNDHQRAQKAESPRNAQRAVFVWHITVATSMSLLLTMAKRIP